MTRIKDFSIGKQRRRAKRLVNLVGLRLMLRDPLLEELLSLEEDECYLPDPVMTWLARKFDEAMRNVSASRRRAREIKASSFNINNWNDEMSFRDFRFTVKDLGRVCDIIAWPSERARTSRCRYKVQPIEATALLLHRLATTSRWSELEFKFGKTRGALSEIFYEVLEHVADTKCKLVTEYRDDLMGDRCKLYAEAIEERGAPLPNCVGFIDGTAIEIARPSKGQAACFSGHKRKHCLKFQSVTTPDGLIFHMYGPLEGRFHDMTLYGRSGLDDILQEKMIINSTQYYIYGDPAYVIRPWLQVGFKGTDLSADRLEFNQRMSRVRMSVEWGFKEIKRYFPRLAFPRQLKTLEVPVGLLYLVGSLLANFRCCLYGSQASLYFECPPPSLLEYVGETSSFTTSTEN